MSLNLDIADDGCISHYLIGAFPAMNGGKPGLARIDDTLMYSFETTIANLTEEKYSVTFINYQRYPNTTIAAIAIVRQLRYGKTRRNL